MSVLYLYEDYFIKTKIPSIISVVHVVVSALALPQAGSELVMIVQYQSITPSFHCFKVMLKVRYFTLSYPPTALSLWVSTSLVCVFLQMQGTERYSGTVRLSQVSCLLSFLNFWHHLEEYSIFGNNPYQGKEQCNLCKCWRNILSFNFEEFMTIKEIETQNVAKRIHQPSSRKEFK